VTVLLAVRGAYREEDIFLGCAVQCGLEKVVVPFLRQGHAGGIRIDPIDLHCGPAERKRLGVLTTDADLFGGFASMSGQQRPRQLIVEELEKQYDVVAG